jgi:two-component sensor histidine kinase
LGETELKNLRLRAGQNSLQLDFAAISFSPGRSLRYQYKLEGMDDDWSPPSDQHTVNYADLPPGAYTFRVRAVDIAGASRTMGSDHLLPTRAAAVHFIILSPIWRRWWFRLPALLIIIGITHALYRYRVAHLLALERLRSRIATDLHDDIGSTVTQIAILSEVAGRHAGTEVQSEPLSDIANLSRELVDSMSEIVWAIDPEQDSLENLAHRMRRFGSDLFSAKGVLVKFGLATGEPNIAIGADVRRQIFLIFKEALHNTVRHSGCTKVEVDFRLERGFIDLRIQDNGKGFDARQAKRGHGLGSMEQRATQLDGRIQIDSAPGCGTTIQLQVPLRRHSRSRLKGYYPNG